MELYYLFIDLLAVFEENWASFGQKRPAAAEIEPTTVLAMPVGAYRCAVEA